MIAIEGRASFQQEFHGCIRQCLLKPVIGSYDDLTRKREILMNVSLTPELEKFVDGKSKAVSATTPAK